MSEYIVKIPDYVPPFDPAVRAASFGEQIVRCRDCRHFTPEGTIWFPDGSVNEDHCDYFKAYKLQITPDGFCAWGVRI